MCSGKNFSLGPFWETFPLMILVYVIASGDSSCVLIETNHVMMTSLCKVTDPSGGSPCKMTHL